MRGVLGPPVSEFRSRFTLIINNNPKPTPHVTTRREEEGEREEDTGSFEIGFDGVGRLPCFDISTKYNSKVRS